MRFLLFSRLRRRHGLRKVQCLSQGHTAGGEAGGWSRSLYVSFTPRMGHGQLGGSGVIKISVNVTFLQTLRSRTAPLGAAGDGTETDSRGLHPSTSRISGLPQSAENTGLRKQQLTRLRCANFFFSLLFCFIKEKKILVSTHNVDFVTHKWTTA